MSAVTRRGVLKGTAIAGSAAVFPLGARAMGTRRLIIYDSRLPASLAFAQTTSAAQTIDLADAHGQRFATLRQGLPVGHRIEALTRWSDHIALRRELYRQGFRLETEARSGNLIRWSMAPR